LAKNACIYTWALVPSFYLYSFMDTNKNYLQSQGIIFPPIIIHFGAVIVHVIICALMATFTTEITFLKVAWSKNITDSLCCLALYFYIIIKEPTKESWVEWNIKATNNIGRFIK
jgi:MATE family multidrug resistance protein